jgi:hypothetical protein
MDYKIAYLAIGILVILIFFKNNKRYIENRMMMNTQKDGFKNINRMNDNRMNDNRKNDNRNNDKNKNKNITNNNELKEKNQEINTLRENIVRLERMNKNMKKNIIDLKNQVSKPSEYGDKEIIKYNKALEDYIENVNKNKASIDLLDIGKDIEDGIYELTNNFSETKRNIGDLFNGDFDEGFQNNNNNNNKNKNKNKTKNSGNNNKNNYKNNENNKNNNNNNDNTNSNKDIINKLQTELINKKTIDKSDETTNSELDEDMMAYFKYIFDKMYEILKKYFNLYINKNNTFNLGNISKENNTLIGGGILFLVISMGLYFIDISS